MNAKKTSLEPMVAEKDIYPIINKGQSWVSKNREKEKLPFYYIGGEYMYLLSEVDLWRRKRKGKNN